MVRLFRFEAEKGASMQFKVGDVVQLKSGGPHMTVVTVGNDGHIHVVWFNQDSSKFDVSRHHFPPEALTALKEGAWD